MRGLVEAGEVQHIHPGKVQTSKKPSRFTAYTNRADTARKVGADRREVKAAHPLGGTPRQKN